MGPSAVTFVSTFTNPGPDSVNPGGVYYQSPISNAGIDFNGIGRNQTVPYNSGVTNIVVMPVACTMKALNVGAFNYFTAGADTMTLTVVKNSVATTMTCAVTTNNNSSSCSDQTHTFTVVGGDTITLRFTQTNTTPYNLVTTSLVCQ